MLVIYHVNYRRHQEEEEEEDGGGGGGGGSREGKRRRAKKTTADQVAEGLQFECRGDVSAAGRHVKSNALVSINH